MSAAGFLGENRANRASFRVLARRVRSVAATSHDDVVARVTDSVDDTGATSSTTTCTMSTSSRVSHRTRIAMKKNASHVNIELDEVDRFWLTSLLMMNVACERDEAHNP